MSDKVSDIISDGGELSLVDVAALSIATTLFLSQGDDEVLQAIGRMADLIKASFEDGEVSEELAPNEESDASEQKGE